MIQQLLSALLAGLATWLWFSPRTPAERLSQLRPRPTQKEQAQPPAEQSKDPTWLINTPPPITKKTITTAACTGLILALLVGGITGIVTGILATPAIALFLHKKQPRQSQHDRRRIAADLPFAADLMTACLLAGRPVSAATDIAANAIGGPLGRRLTWVSTQLRLGADPEPTWAALAKDPATAQLSRAMSRAAQSGAPVADVLTRLADDARETAGATAVASARSVGVKAVAPLGLCFLPAFVLLGIIPIIAGLAATIILP
ncbi:type II secretion system F family protein [Nonomuraea phyllanthi]|uniref:type II secretion system F family protein n=1 Tax=Nonomuraea phyllanthi TaxID=2219224 RepID=UPI001D15A436|nr:type II secretion system F family protein [Nonomuraea phyllanthi]